MQKTYFEIVMRNIKCEKANEIKQLIDGTILIGHIPHIAPHAWLHNIYPVLSESDIQDVEKKIGSNIPLSYREFLLYCSNGFSMFLNTLSLFGVRKKTGRTIEAAWQPFSIYTSNITERPLDALPNYFFIGSYNWDGSLAYIDTLTGKVYRSSNESVIPLNIWENFETMLLSETKRISSLFNEYGFARDEEQPTTP